MHTLRLLFAYPYDEVRDLCHKVKENAYTVRRDQLEPLALALPQKTVLVPVPGHKGHAGYTLDLAYRLQETAKATGKDARVVDALKGNPRESLCLLKQNGADTENIPVEYHLNPEEIDSEGIQLLTRTFRIVLVDNVIDTGRTAHAAMEALGADCGIITIGTTGKSGFKTPPQYYEIVRFSTQDTEKEEYETVRKWVDHGMYLNSIDYMSQWDYGGENIDTARCFGKIWPTPQDPREHSDKVLIEEGNYHLCLADSTNYKAIYLSKTLQA